MVFSEVNNHRYKHWESLVLVGLQDGEEVVILEEAHGSIGYLQMGASNAPHNSSEKWSDEWLNLLNLTNLKHFLQFRQEKSFLYAIGKRPEFEEAF